MTSLLSCLIRVVDILNLYYYLSYMRKKHNEFKVSLYVPFLLVNLSICSAVESRPVLPLVMLFAITGCISSASVTKLWNFHEL